MNLEGSNNSSDYHVSTLYVYLTFHQNPNWKRDEKSRRLQFLATNIFYLSQLPADILDLKVISNLEITEFNEICQPVVSRGLNDRVSQYVANKDDLRDPRLGISIPWLLTWTHKQFMRKDLDESLHDINACFLVLEDDAIFTQANLEYFLRYKTPMREIGLIPSFIRAEWSLSVKCWIHPDSFERIDFNSDIFNCPFNESKKLLQRNNPFSASILFDAQYCREYFESESSVQQLACFKHKYIFDIGSTATLGLICESIPSGYKSRTAVLVDTNSFFPEPGSVIRHQGDRYANDPWQKHFRLYDAPNLSTPNLKRSFLQITKRLLMRDVHIIIRNYLKRIISVWIRK